MDSVGVRELRQNLSVYLRRVRQGEALRVTEHGHPVAVLVPLPADDDPLADLVAAGKITRARGKLSDLLPLPPDDDPAKPTLSQVLRQMRDEERY